MTKWLDYQQTMIGHHVPYINGYLEKDGVRVVDAPIRFLIDTGSVFSFAPRFLVAGSFDFGNIQVVKTGCLSLGGDPLEGQPVEFVVAIPAFGLKVAETIYFRDGEKQKYAVLGHQSFLKSLRATFCSGVRNGILSLKQFSTN